MKLPNRYCTATVLLVEDDPGDQALTRRALEEGHLQVDLRIVEDGEQALDYLRRNAPYLDAASAPRPDLVLLDLNLPRKDGREVLAEIRADENLRKIPVVALTTSRHERDVACTYELGVNSYIPKPVEMEDFVRVLRELGNYWFNVVTLPTFENFERPAR